MRGLALIPLAAIITTLSLLPKEAYGHMGLYHISTVYLPAANGQQIAFDETPVEQIAYDPVRKLIYAAGSQVFHVINATNPANLTVELSHFEDNSEFTDVEVCGDHVFLSVVNSSNVATSVLRVHKSFDMERADSLELVVKAEVGPGAEMFQVLSDCKTAVVAVEGEAYVENGTPMNPKGQVTIVQLQEESGQTTAKVTPLYFDAFNDRYDQLKAVGVRFVYMENSSLSQDLEPENVAIDTESNKAYVVLQENNAIAEVDLATLNITNIHGLGYKRWGGLDASDMDGAMRITYWPIRAWYLPDGVKFYQWQGKKLLFTANEGSLKDYSTATPFNESVRGKDIPTAELGDGIHEMVKSALTDDKLLGRLQFSSIDGKDENGNYSALYTYGGRSLSIWDLTSAGDDPSRPLSRMFDSGSQIEENTANRCPHLFNRQGDTVDARSDSKGPEPESVTVGEINNHLYIFVGNERPGTIAVFRLTKDFQFRFEKLFCGGIPDDSPTMMQSFADGKLFGVDPEDLRFIPAAESPTGTPVLMVVGTKSGTVSLLEVKNPHATTYPNMETTEDDGPQAPPRPTSPTCPNKGSFASASLVLAYLCVLLHLW